MSNTQYELLLPTAAQPAGGYLPSSQIDFIMNHPGRALKEGTLRLTGLLSVTNDGDPILPLQAALNGNAGAHSLLNHLMVMFDGSMVESIVEYPRFVASETEALHSCVELGAQSDQIVELKTASQTGMKTDLSTIPLEGQAVGDQADKIPFSILLRCCLNNSSAPVSFSKTGQVHLRFTLQQPSDVFWGPAVNVADISYSISEMALRYQTHDDIPMKDKTILERVSYAGQQTIVSSYNTFSTTAPVSFDSAILLFRNSTHVNTTTCAWDPVLNENFYQAGASVIPNYVEYSLSGQDTPLSFPLRSQEEFLTNYILAHAGDSRKHGLNLAKLNQYVSTDVPNYTAQPCGFGLGVHFGEDKASQPLQVTINFAEAPADKYNVYVFYKGKMLL